VNESTQEVSDTDNGAQETR